MHGACIIKTEVPTRCMTANTILVTPRSLTRDGHPALARLERAGYRLLMGTPGQQPDEEALLRLVPGCVGYLAGVEPVSRRVLERAVNLRVISRNGTGIDNIDLEAAHQRNIAVMRAEGANARGVAELAVGLLLALVRNISLSDRCLKAGTWQRHLGCEIKGRTLGLIGCGQIGQLVAHMAIGLGMRVVAFDPFPDTERAAAVGFSYVPLEQLLAASDIISLHCPPSRDSEPVITRQGLTAMKDGVYLVNTARGELLDDDAVIEFLDNGKLAGVAVDAFRREPPGLDRLVIHERVIAVPHIGAYTEESVTQAVEMAVDNLLLALGE